MGTDSGIRGLADLQGRKIGVTRLAELPNTPKQTLYDQLARHGLRAQDVRA